MANTIKLGYSNTSGQSPDTLEGGEVGINTSNRKVWVGNGTGNTLVFNHADYAPASANASESYVTSRGYITDGNTGWNNSYGFVTSSGVTSVATSGAINGGTITGTGTISHSTAAGNKHIPTGGSAGQFLKYSASGTAVWAADNNSTYTLASLGFTGATNANYFTYSHPTGNGNNHVPANGSSGQFLKYSSAGTAVWAADNNSTYTLASLGYTGATNANYFTCTLASLGGVTSAYVLNQLDNLVDAAPGALNTLNELAAAIGDDASYATTVTNALAGKAAASGNATQSWVSSNFNNYSHPTGNGNKHIPSGGSSGQFLKYSSAGTAVWAADNNTTYTLASLGYTGATNATYTPSYSMSPGGSTIVQRHSSGYIFSNYINTTADTSTSLGHLSGRNTSDTYHRWYTAATVRSFLGVAASANNYSHPTGNGNNHIPANGSSGQFLKYSSAGVATWAADNNTTYTLASLGFTGATNANYFTCTLSSLGFTGATNANYITNNNQLTNGAGYTNNTVANAALPKAGGTMTGDTHASNYGIGQVGVYSSYRYQAVWSMGNAYKLAANGTTVGSLYGIAYTHTNMGGQSKAGLDHQALFMTNGVTKSAIGTGIWTTGVITGTSNLVLSGTATWSGGGSANANTAYTHSQAAHAPSNANYFTYSHPTGNGNNHVPANGSAGQFLKYSSAGVATWAADNNSTYTLASLGFTGATNANYFTYSHPTGNGNNHIPANGSSGQFLKYSSAGVATWAADNNSTYTLASLGYTGATNANYFTCTLASLGYTGATNATYTPAYAVAAGANTIVQRHASGYIYCNYLNITPNDIATGSVTSIVAESGNDGWTRHAPKAAVLSFLNVADGATNFTCTLSSLGFTGATNANYITNTNQLTNGSGYITGYTDTNTTYTAGTGMSLAGTVFNCNVVNTDTNTTYSASNGVYMTGTDVRHSGNGAQGSINLSGQNFIQDLTLDAYGHITGYGYAAASGGGGGGTTWNGMENISVLNVLP